ncbi:MAG: phosphate transporter, permease protein PstA [Bacteroidota bacterium]|nr:phosphate transporter, permease protein PstA [Bacteroidota bacterium]
MANKRNRRIDKAFRITGLLATCFGVFVLIILLGSILIKGVTRLNFQFLSSLPSRFAAKAGILSALSGTLWIFGLTALFAIPVGIGAAVYLEEYGKKNKLGGFIEINISNLAGVPSIIYGLLGLGIFVHALKFGPVILAGALTLALLILPIIIVSTREALKAVPKTIREAAYGLGATKWQVIRTQVLPASAGGILTGMILALARAIGETAPLIVVGALAYVPFVPKSPFDNFSVLPMQIFNWVSRPQKEFTVNAAAAIIVLLVITFILNGFAVFLRNKWQQKVKW